MSRVLIAGLAIVLGTMPALAVTGSGGESLPMQFWLRQEGPAALCGNHCHTLVFARGSITAETPETFAVFANRTDVRGATVVLESGGGSVHGAMALGREIRSLRMNTTVGRRVDLPGRGKHGRRLAAIAPRADCESMCAFVLLAGVKRTVPPQARVMVHQIWLGDRRDDAAAATYTAADLVLVQHDVGLLAQYTADMGVSMDLLERSLRIPPWEPLYRLSSAEMLRMRVETGPASADTPVAAKASATVARASATSGMRPAPEPPLDPDTSRGWFVVDQSGRPELARHHPLTLQGRELGSFDLTLSCAAQPAAFDITYSEQRIPIEGAKSDLKAVSLSLGAWSGRLDVLSSQVRRRTQDVATVARGTIPTGSIADFSADDGGSLTVRTVSAGELHTSIRVGNTGISAILGRLRQSCGRHAYIARHARMAANRAR